MQDRVRGRKQKDGRDRKKENGLQLSESQEVEVRKEPVLEFEYWSDPKCGSKFKQLGPAKEQVCVSKDGRAKVQNKEETKKSEGVPNRSEIEEKRENEKENASTKNEVIQADSVVKKDGNENSENENSAMKSEKTLPINYTIVLSKTEDHESEGMSLDIQPATKLPLDKGSDNSSIAITVSGDSTILSDMELRSQLPDVNCAIIELPFKTSSFPKISLSEIPEMQSAGSSDTNISQGFSFPSIAAFPPSQANIGFGTYQGGVDYYTYFGEQHRVYLINGLNQCFASLPDQNTPLMSATFFNFAQDAVLRPLQTPPTYEGRNCQIGIDDNVHISGQHSVPSPFNVPLTNMLQRAVLIFPLPVLDAKSFQTATNFSCFGFQKLPRHASETSLSSFSPSLPSLSFKQPLCGPPLDVASCKGSTSTTQVSSLDVMNALLQNNSYSSNGTRQNTLSTNITAQGFTLPDSPFCPKQRLPNVPLSVSNIISYSLSMSKLDLFNFPSLEQGIVANKMRKSPQCINAQFLVNHQNGMSTTGNVNNTAQSNKVSCTNLLYFPYSFIELWESTFIGEDWSRGNEFANFILCRNINISDL